MPFLPVFIILLFLFYLPPAGSQPKDSPNLKECSESFSDESDKKEDFHQRAERLLIQISRSSANKTAEILKREHPETIRILSRRVFLSQRMVVTKYNLAYALGENQTDDPEIHRILSDSLLWEENKGVQREVAHALGEINGKIDPADSQIQSNLVEVIQSQKEVGIRLQAIYALGETRSKDIVVHWFLIRKLLSEEEPPLIKQAIVRAIIKMKPTSFKISQTLLTALLSEETTNETKQAVAEVLGEMPLDTNTSQELARILSMRREFDTEESIELKQKVAEAVKNTESRDYKTHQLLAEALTTLKGEKYARIREEIYSLFESVSQHIKIKIRQRLTDIVGSADYSFEEKQRIIGILNQSQSRYKLTTVQKLGIAWLISLF